MNDENYLIDSNKDVAPPWLWYVNFDGNNFKVSDGISIFNIPFIMCETPEEILSCIALLCKEKWMRTHLIREFVKVATEVNKVTLPPM